MIILLWRWAEITATAFSGFDCLTFWYNYYDQKFDIITIRNEHEHYFFFFSVGHTWRGYCLLGPHVQLSLQHRCLCPRWERRYMTIMILNLFFSSDSVNGGHGGNGSADEGVYCPSNQTLGEAYIYNHTLLPTRWSQSDLVHKILVKHLNFYIVAME